MTVAIGRVQITVAVTTYRTAPVEPRITAAERARIREDWNRTVESNRARWLSGNRSWPFL